MDGQDDVSLPFTTAGFDGMMDWKRHHVSSVEFLNAMNARRIGTGVHYLSVPEHPHYQRRFGWTPEHWPNAMRIGRQTVSLPLSPKPTDADVTRAITTVRRLVA